MLNKSSYPLLRNQCYVDGQWVHAKNNGSIGVINPATGEQLGEVPHFEEADTQKAIDAAQRAFQSWAKRSASDRSQIVRKWYELIMQHAEELAKILTLEQGKPYKEALGEIKYGASFIEWFAEEGKRVYGDLIPGHQADKRIVVIKQPIGVVAAITPWNFPNAMITRKVAPALVAGCSVIVKPSEETPFSALALAALGEEAGFPAGVLNVITTNDAQSMGTQLCASKVVRKISFTGSTPVGKWLMEHSAKTMKKLSLELGGNAPFIVFEDADLEKAVQGAIASKYRNAGQTCVCANRIFVQKGIYDAFIKRFTEEVKKQKVGNGLDEGVVIGPLINQKAIEKVQRLLKDAVEKGAKIQTGGSQHEQGSQYFEPTVLSEATPQMSISEEEIFGPVAAVYPFNEVDEVIEMANNTDAGLAAYFYANDLSKVWKVAEALEYGMVGINTGMISTAVAPFGGVKESGFGREGSKYGLEEYLVMKYLCMEV